MLPGVWPGRCTTRTSVGKGIKSPSLRRMLTGTGSPVSRDIAGRARAARKRERKGLGAGYLALYDVRLRLMDGNGDSCLVDKLGEAAPVIGVRVGNDDTADLVEGEAAAQEAAGNYTRTPRQSRVDEKGVAGLGENGDPGADCPQLEDAVGNSDGLAKQVMSPAMD